MEDKINKIVLTGGTANLNQISVLFRQMTGYAVRQGMPNEKKILPNSCSEIFNYASSTVAGLVLKGFEYEQIDEEEEESATATAPANSAQLGKETEPPIEKPQGQKKPDKKTFLSGIFSNSHPSKKKKKSEKKTEPIQQKNTLFDLDGFFNETDDEA